MGCNLKIANDQMQLLIIYTKIAFPCQKHPPKPRVSGRIPGVSGPPNPEYLDKFPESLGCSHILTKRQSNLKSGVSGLLIGVSGLPSPEYPAPNPEYLAYTGQTGHKFLPSPH